MQAIIDRLNRVWYLRAAVWAMVIVALYYPTVRTPPFFDDVYHAEFVARWGASIVHQGPVFFRPFERLLIGLSWSLTGLHFWPAKLMSMALLLGRVIVVDGIVRRIVPADRTALILSVPTIYLVDPMHVSAVIKIDTISEGMAAFFALCLVFVMIDIAHRRRYTSAILLRYIAGSGLICLLGMLSKESFGGMALALPLLAAVALYRKLPAVSWLKAVVGFGLSDFVVALIYFPLRYAAGFGLAGAPAIDRYKIGFGLNVLKNVAADFIAVAYPGSTTDIFVEPRAVAVVISIAIVAVSVALFYRQYRAFVAALLSGRLVTQSEGQALVILLIAAVAATIPTCLISALISENQAEPLIGPVVLLWLCIPAIVSAWTDPRKIGIATDRDARHPIAFALGCVATIWMANATAEKVLMARDMGERADQLGRALLHSYNLAPNRSVVLCFGDGGPNDRNKYSIFSIPDSILASAQLYRIRIMSPDIKTETIDLSTNPQDANRCTITLTEPIKFDTR